MSDRSSTKSPIKLLLLLSMLIHGSVVGVLMLSDPIYPRETKSVTDTVSIKLSQRSSPSKPEPAPETPEPPKDTAEPEALESTTDTVEQEAIHAPTHNSDSFASNNQDENIEGKVVAGGGNKADKRSLARSDAPTPNTKQTPLEKHLIEVSSKPETHKIPEKARDIVTTNGPSASQTNIGEADSFKEGVESEEAADHNSLADAMGLSGAQQSQYEIDVEPTDSELEIPGEYLTGLGNLEILSDGQLSEAIVEQPFTEEQSNELKLVNKYLARMSAQVKEFWINPYKGNKKLKGIIKLELSPTGDLLQAYVFRSSGHSLLDVSVLDAIRAVPRYDVPNNQIIAQRYYTNLSFYYSSIEDETELMPFEKKAEALN